MKIKTSRVLFDVDAGASNELPLIIKQSFKDDRYSPSIGMEEVANNVGVVYSEWSGCKE
jgi:hypothetical protein